MNIHSICKKHTRSLLVAMLLIISCAQASAQFRLVDKADGQPVAGAYILDDNNQLLCMSDADGQVKALQGNVIISTLSYQPLTIDASTTHGDVALEQKEFALPEVVVKKADYIKVRGAFRDICTNNDKTILYREGIEDFYINTKNGKIKRHVWACREYEHKKLRKLFSFETFMLYGKSFNMAKVNRLTTDSVSSTKGDTTFLAISMRKYSADDACMVITDQKKGLYRAVIDNAKLRDMNSKSLTISTNISDWTFSQPESNMSALVSFRGLLQYTWRWDKQSDPIECKEIRDFVTLDVLMLDKKEAEEELKDKSETDVFDLPDCLPAISYDVSQETQGLEKRTFWE